MRVVFVSGPVDQVKVPCDQPRSYVTRPEVTQLVKEAKLFSPIMRPVDNRS
jgi:hypothetical protein